MRLKLLQIVPVYDDTGNIKGNLTILKSWRSSEKEILESFLSISGWAGKNPPPFRFFPVGYNLPYDLTVIRTRCRELLKKEIPWEFLFHELAKVDLKQSLVLANKGQFKGCSLDKFTRKKASGEQIREFIRSKQWTKLVAYIKEEATAFLELGRFLLGELPPLLKNFKKYL